MLTALMVSVMVPDPGSLLPAAHTDAFIDSFFEAGHIHLQTGRRPRAGICCRWLR